MRIRSRCADDVPACVEILRRTHQTDGYPLVSPTAPESFVIRPLERAAWVAVVDGSVVGHVSNQLADGWPGLPLLKSAVALSIGEVSVVSALFTSVEHRRSGLGRALLDHASAEARATGCQPVLDVGKSLTSAVALYERASWTRLGEVAFLIGTTTVESWIYLGPVVTADLGRG